MSKIEKLTPEQEAQIEVYKAKYLAQGLCTDRLDKEKALSAIRSLYKILDLKLSDDHKVFYFDSPEAMTKFAAENTGLSQDSFTSKICFANVANYWASFYSFITNVLGVDKERVRVDVLDDVVKNCGPFLMFDKAILISERPTKIALLEDNVTKHCSDGPALDYADGLSRGWYLNNVKVNEFVVMTKPEDFTKEHILQETNADIRREIVRKIPAKRLAEILDADVVEECVIGLLEYKLLNISINGDRFRPYLEMINPSIKTVHIEGVHPDCKTVKDAILWRNSDTELPYSVDGIVCNPNGKTIQQGDCLFKKCDAIPTSAVKVFDNIAGEGLVRHMISNAEVFVDGNKRYLNIDSEANVTHPEHNTVTLSSGRMEVIKVLEYDHYLNESREIVD